MRGDRPLPWEHDILFRDQRCCLTQYEVLSNYDLTYWKIGDLIKFQHGFIGFDRNEEWQSWYLKDEDLQKYLEENFPRHEKVPKYARNQYAIILARYKFTKFKCKTFRDYGSIVMMLTGSNVGHIRRFYNCSPWDRVDMFPYCNIEKHIDHDTLFHGVKINRNKLKFLEKLMEKISYDYY